MKNVFKRIFKTLLTSLLVTFFAMLVLMIGNKIMGVERVGIVYILLGGLCFSMLFVGLIFARQDYIFNKTPKELVEDQLRKKYKGRKHPKTTYKETTKEEKYLSDNLKKLIYEFNIKVSITKWCLFLC
ncbi:MAG: hypothetical protein V8S33_05575 [Intestinibacter bartlettii]